MYKDRMFDTWSEGLVYFVIVVLMPIIPIVVYLINREVSDGYLHVLIIATIVPLFYEFSKEEKAIEYGTFLKIENMICCVVLTLMVAWDIFLLIYIFEKSSNFVPWLVRTGYIVVGMFVVPVGIVIIEIARSCIVCVKTTKAIPHENNLVKGAKKV